MATAGKESNGSNHSVKKGLGSVYGAPLRISLLGFTLAILWSHTAQRIAQERFGDFPHSLIFVGIATGCLLFFFGSHALKENISTNRHTLYIGSISSLALSLVITFVPDDSSTMLLFPLLFLVGLSIAWLYVLWGDFYAKLNIRQASVLLLLSMAFSTLISFVLSFLAIEGAFGIAVSGITPLLAAVSWHQASKSLPHDSQKAKRFTHESMHYFKPTIIGVVATTFTLGVLRMPFPSFTLIGLSYNTLSQLLTLSACAYFLYFLYKNSRGIEFSRILFIILIVFTASMALRFYPLDTVAALHPAAINCAQSLVITFLYLALSDIAHNSDYESDKVFGLGWCLYVAPFLFGTLCAHLFPGFFSEPYGSILLLLAILIVLFLILSTRIPTDLALFLDLNPIDADYGRQIQQCVEVLGERYQLSEREKEVITLYAQGRSRAYIASTLFVSESTARAHIYSTYKKMGIHSKQELIDAIKEIGVTV